jgi:hypothetical protein
VQPYTGPLATAAQDFTGLTGVPVDLEQELFLRARLLGLRSPGGTSAGGSCHLMRAADGWAAVNLAREDDLASVPALINLLGGDTTGTGAAGTPETAPERLRAAAGSVRASEVAEQAQRLGIAAAALGSERQTGNRAVTRVRVGEPLSGRPRAVQVVDFSSLWAGPLCARLLGLAGADVTKVESRSRPDGARRGCAAFYRHLHTGHRSVTLDFTPGRLRESVADADVVIEASRPRALRRMGLDAERFLTARPGRVWVGITGYGRDDVRIAFGDDAAIAGGLVGRASAHGEPTFLGDALADPVTGVFAAHAVTRALADGGGHLVSVSMAGCAALLAASAGAGRSQG